ncbi:SRPBCC family protein [Bacillus cereus]|uniref:SRPBCC family protein n=1 Tax=Bacillus cereus TaxID=1396 RepID=UPI000BFD23FF|nr:SRPBCC family protein [Bacillus cereus]PGK36716.1 polyketide cyclase [Bacillus cereus]
MPRIKNSIFIEQVPQKVFDLTNDIENWPQLFNDYSDAKVLKKEVDTKFTKLEFQLSNKLSSWVSTRILDKKGLIAYAQRIDPMYPFQYMHLTWKYEKKENGTLMTWTQDFELDEKFPDSLNVVVNRMNQHTIDNQIRIKNIIEQQL